MGIEFLGMIMISKVPTISKINLNSNCKTSMDVRLNPTFFPKEGVQSNMQEGKVKDGCNAMYALNCLLLILT